MRCYRFISTHIENTARILLSRKVISVHLYTYREYSDQLNAIHENNRFISTHIENTLGLL